jgi:hypothetical protein
MKARFINFYKIKKNTFNNNNKSPVTLQKLYLNIEYKYKYNMYL